MEDALKAWLFDPVTGRIVAALVGVLIVALVRLLQRTLARYVQDTDVVETLVLDVRLQSGRGEAAP